MHTLYVDPRNVAEWIPCPCCGYKTVTGEWQSCRICGWEISCDDWRAGEDPDADFIINPDSNGDNWYSIRQAQENFRLFGASTECTFATLEAPTEKDIRTRDWKEFPAPLKGNEFHDPDFPIWNLTCPCCGFITIHGGWERCEICGWFFCPQQQNPDEKRGPNEVTLREAQRNHAAFGAKSELLVPHVRKPGPQDQRDPAWIRLRTVRGGNLSESTCRCCGHKIIQSRGDECPICGWTSSNEPVAADERHPPNEVTLRQAQRNFRNFGAKSTLAMARVRRPTAGDQRNPCWRPADDPLTTVTTAFFEVGGVKLLDVTCACCGHKAVSASGWNCQVCWWEYYTAHQDPFDRSQPNPRELREAQWNYLKHDVSRPEIERAPNPLFKDREDPDWKPLDELDSNES